jgi:hypothetical protein
MITATVQASNAIKWIDSLKGGSKGFKKGIGSLGVFDWGNNNGKTTPDRFCCLGVGVKVLDIDIKTNSIEEDCWDMGHSEELAYKVGLNSIDGDFLNPDGTQGMICDVTSIIDLNDDVYDGDLYFTNMRKEILNNLDLIFKPKVAQKLKAHYSTRSSRRYRK